MWVRDLGLTRGPSRGVRLLPGGERRTGSREAREDGKRSRRREGEERPR